MFLLNVMAYPCQSIQPRLLREGIGGEGEVNPREDPFGDQIAVGS